MRRKEKAVTEKSDIEAIIKSTTVCRLAMSDDNHPYIVPLCFGYADDTLFFHCAAEGKKLDILKKNNRVCFEFDIDTAVTEGKTACNWGMAFQSVIGTGRAMFVEDPAAKRSALDVIMGQYAGGEFEFSEETVLKTIVFKVDIESMTGKRSG